MKFSVLFGKVAHITHTTQQNFVIGQFAKMNIFHWSRHPWQYLNQYLLAPNKISTTSISSIHIHQASQILCTNPWACATKSTMQCVPHLWESQ